MMRRLTEPGTVAMLVGIGAAVAAFTRHRRHRTAAPMSGQLTMAEMTRKLAREQPPTAPGSGTIAWRPSTGAHGMSQNESLSGQPLDSRMSQQFHQPRQGTDGGHAAGVNVPDDRADAPGTSD